MSPQGQSQKSPFPVFIATTIVIFFLALSAADSVGFIPDYLDQTEGDLFATPAARQASADALSISQLPTTTDLVNPMIPTALPVRISIPAIDLDLAVQNPATRDILALDELLKKGPARYVDSAKLGPKGNMIIFAHSSHLPIVHNQMYRAFNRIPDLQAGDTITIEGDDGKSYLYSVVDVHKADANEDKIDLSPEKGTRLTLVTCDTLTSKSSRFILTADFVGTIDS
jgi:LPXTG-site transpeptidase (sortase) family protein